MKVILLSVLATLPFGDADATLPTPAETAIEQALKTIGDTPDDARTYNRLALALARRARETADPAYYERGLGALAVSDALMPDNYGSRRVRAWILLGQHRFEEALELAEKLNKEMPDDTLVYGFLADGHVELGNYETAEWACQWMLDMRPGGVPGLTRASYLRELFGDVEGALQLMAQAYHGVRASEREDQAWILTHMAHLHRSVGRNAEARPLLERALALFPDYHYALAELAHVCLASAEPERAVELFRRRHELAPHPENLYDLAVAMEGLEDSTGAKELFARFEEQALAESTGLDNANRELILFYTDHAQGRASEALVLAEREAERRHDVATLELLAWSLQAVGRSDEAQRVMTSALKPGFRNARLLLHAGVIAAQVGKRELARGYLLDCRALQPGPDVLGRANALLVELEDAGDA